MNGKLVFRGGFLACLHYIFHKEGARYLGSNLAIENASPKLTNLALTSIASQFECIANRSHRIRKPVMHLSLSPHPDDAYQLDDEDKQSFVQQLLERIGMKNCQWILGEHDDTYTPEGYHRPHFHVVVNRIPIDSQKAVNSSFIKWRVEEALQQLRKEYNLTLIEASWNGKRKAPSTGEVRHYRQQEEQYRQGERNEPPEIPVKVQLQDAIDTIAPTCTTLFQFTEDLKQRGIELEIFSDSELSERPTGFTYHYGQNYHFRGSQLGRAYTPSGLEKYYHINLELAPSKPSQVSLVKDNFEIEKVQEAEAVREQNNEELRLSKQTSEPSGLLQSIPQSQKQKSQSEL